MSNFKRKKQKQPKGDTWSHRPEPDPEPDPSKSGSVKKKKKKLWVVTALSRSFRTKELRRVVVGRYHTEDQAEQAKKTMKHQEACWAQMFPKQKTFWFYKEHEVEYQGKDK